MIRLLRRLFRPRMRRKEQNRVKNLRAVRTNQRLQLPGYAYDYGDYEVNKENARKLREQAQKKDG